MKMRARKLAAAAVVAAGFPAAMLLVGVMACGPDWEPEVFVPAHQPESPKLYAEGHLGVVQPGYFHAELVVAFRYLSGGRLSDAEKATYTAGPQATGRDREYGSGPGVNWLLARANALGLTNNNQPWSFTLDQDRAFKKAAGGVTEVDFELNCTDGAFSTAIATLAQRSDKWGAKSEELQEWVRGQDAVFSNCNKEGTIPDAAKPGWPVLLRQDRAYQIAAAKFYAADYDGAIADFVVIGKDASSPWSTWGEYLAARAEVRKAASVPGRSGEETLGNFDQTGLRAAQTRLLRVEQTSKDTGMKQAAAAELGFVEVRLNPGKRLDEVSRALAGPKPDAAFAQDLADLDYLMDRNVAGDSELPRWIVEMQKTVPNSASRGVPGAKPAALDALSGWRAQHSTPWLVAALAETKAGDASSAELLNAAAAVKRDSPAYASVNFYRIGLLLDAKKAADARGLADSVIAGMGPETMGSTRNAFLAERFRTARNLAEFLADAPRVVIDSGSSAAAMAQCSGRIGGEDCKAKLPPQFDADGATSMNVLMPLAMWEDAAVSNVLPKNLRDAVAWAAWLRAMGLGDAPGVKKMAALLPVAVAKTAGDSDGFPAALALLRNPGMRPYLEQGVQRSATFAELDSFRDNWWCGRWTDGGGNGGIDPNDSNTPQVKPYADFLTTAEKKQASDEDARLNALPSGTVWIGRQAIAYVKAHPDDKNAAEALALTVRATHFSCSGESDTNDQKAVSKESFEMLHRLYPKSEWAMKTKYYY